MNTPIAATIAAIIIAALLADHFYFEWDLLIVSARYLQRLSEWLAFWR